MFIAATLCLAFATVLAPVQGTSTPPPPGKTRVQVPPIQAPAPAAPTPAPGNPVVVVSTSMGDITLELFKDRAPVSIANFLQYVADGHYEGTIFHRVRELRQLPAIVGHE